MAGLKQPKVLSFQFATLVCIAIIALLLSGVMSTISAQPAEAPRVTPKLEEIIEKARKDGVQVVVVDSRNVANPTPEPERRSLAVRIQADAVRARARLFEILAGTTELAAQAKAAIARKSPLKSVSWPLLTAGLTMLFLLGGWLVRALFIRSAEGTLLKYFQTTPNSNAEKIGFLYTRATIGFVGLAIQVLVAALLVLAFDMGRNHLRYTALIVIGYWSVVSGFALFFRNLLAVDIPQFRAVRIGDLEAQRFYSELVGVVAFGMLVLGLCFWIDLIGIDRDAHVLMLGGASLVVALTLSLFVVRHRHDVAQMLYGGRPEFAWSIWQRLVASLWHIPVVLYLLTAWLVTAVRLLLGKSNAIGLVGFPILFVLGAVALFGAFLLIVELFFSRSDAKTEGLTGNEGGGEVTLAISETSTLTEPPTYKRLAERTGAMLAIVLVVAATLALWGINPLAEDSWAEALLDMLIVAFLAYICWSAAKIAIDRKIFEEGGPVEIAPGEIGGAGASRLSTLLPLFANFLFILIATIAIIIILSEMGVDVTPLFAGAGIVGLAIGFGAQTLVRDILSGVFFLVDDAFRQGEYIDVGEVKGTVESISLRSMQLRHHLGPLNTIPFGEIKNVQNFSRDWVMMKLPLRLTYETDAEKVRKLINNYGKELLKDPQVGEDFLQPLKSQGVIQMDESAMIMRVKFMTKPGAQWVIRRKVLNGIRELFEKEGITFAHHEVTVRVAASAQKSEQLTAEQKSAAGGAAQRISRRTLDDVGAPEGTSDEP